MWRFIANFWLFWSFLIFQHIFGLFLSARQDARAYSVYSGLEVTVPKFLPLVPLFTVSAAGLDSVFPFKDYIL